MSGSKHLAYLMPIQHPRSGVRQRLPRLIWTVFGFRKGMSRSRHTWRGGGFWDGAPLMRILRRKEAADSPEAEAVAERLCAIATRGKNDVSSPESREGAPPADIKQRFWTPDELSQGRG
jgi:hypothetical protein